MKFTTREDVEAPIEHVWAQVSDFSGFERQIIRRGAQLQRLDSGPVVVGSQWKVTFQWRGKERKVKACLSTLDAPQAMVFDTVASGIESRFSIDLVALSPMRTRISVALDMSAKSLSARLLLQSLKLAKSNLNGRFKTRISDYAEQIEGRYVKT